MPRLGYLVLSGLSNKVLFYQDFKIYSYLLSLKGTNQIFQLSKKNVNCPFFSLSLNLNGWEGSNIQLKKYLMFRYKIINFNSVCVNMEWCEFWFQVSQVVFIALTFWNTLQGWRVTIFKALTRYNKLGFFIFFNVLHSLIFPYIMCSHYCLDVSDAICVCY